MLYYVGTDIRHFDRRALNEKAQSPIKLTHLDFSTTYVTNNHYYK